MKTSNNSRLILKKDNNSNKNKSWLKKFAKTSVINGVIQLKRISAIAKLNGHNSYIGLSHMQVALKQSTDTRGKIN